MKKDKKEKNRIGWAIYITIITFILSMSMNVATNEILKKVNIYIAFSVLLAVILIGIVFDIIGIAVTSVSEAPFHARNAKGMKGGKEAIALIRSADKVSNFCNDVIGDIAGVISGGLAATIVALMTQPDTMGNRVMNLVLAGIVAALTVGGKAMGKGIALSKGDDIIAFVGRTVYTFKMVFHCKKRNTKKSRKEN